MLSEHFKDRTQSTKQKKLPIFPIEIMWTENPA